MQRRMRKLIALLKGEGNRKRRREVPNENLWMREQLSRMSKMKQGIISMSGGR